MRHALARGAFAALCLLGMVQTAAQSFEHKDWLLACDNTRTCRAAGYQRDGSGNAVSVLLTRTAGPGTPVDGRLMLGRLTLGSDGVDVPPLPERVVMRVDGRALGAVFLSDGEGELAPRQVAALLKALMGKSELAFMAGKHRWRLSDEGAAAALLKMDELQGRVGTPSALARKGQASETRVLPPLLMPAVQAARIAEALPDDATLPMLIGPHLRAADDDCPSLKEAGQPPQVWRLSATKMLVSSLCWRGAYNEGYGYWVANDKPPYAPGLVTAGASEFDGAAGMISSAQKGRGLGDCWLYEQWVWNGQDFLHTASATTGLCKLVAAGGAWDMPTLVTEVRPAR